MNSSEVDEMCAACGKEAVDNIKLKKCACNLVKYCSVECQKNHRPQHKKACKKRLAEIRNDNLFTQPNESHLGECPICCLPLPLDTEMRSKSTLHTCCSKIICLGCDYANYLRETSAGLKRRCPFCREALPKNEEEQTQNNMERIEANDSAAMCQMGKFSRLEGDYETALEYWTKAAGLGNADAHYNLSLMYNQGKGVEKDNEKEMYHLEEAAIGGHPFARCNLGVYETQNCRFERAVKHFAIAAKLGSGNSLKALKRLYADGFASKEEYANALRGHQAAVDATKSEQRTTAYAFKGVYGLAIPTL